MSRKPITPEIRQRITELIGELETISKVHGISKKNEQIWHASLDCDRFLIVVADGFGGARLIRGRGEAASDSYLELDVRTFADERKACHIASRIVDEDEQLDIDEAFDAGKTPEEGIEAN